jgi:two-component system cell cycle sensor histidine kinase/response regulator CckA
MKSLDSSIARTTTLMAAIIAAIVGFVIPAGYFAISYQYMEGSMDAHLELSSRTIENLVMKNPYTWQFEEIRLQDLLQHRIDLEIGESWVVKDIKGNVIAEVKEPILEPLVTRRSNVYDAGTQVAILEVSRSMSSLLLHTATVCTGSVLLGIIIFVYFRVVPLRALRNAYRSLEENEQALRRSEEFTRSILDSVDEGFLVIDRKYRIIAANKTYCRWTGAACQEIISKNCYEVSQNSPVPCYKDGEDCAPKHAFETGEPYVSVHKHESPKGTLLYFETKAFPLKDPSGNVTSVIETFHNITERHMLETERSKSQKLEAIGILAGGIAHDFNNLLQGVFGYISLAKLSIDRKEKVMSLLQQAEKGLKMSVNLTAQLLTFSKGGRPVKKRIMLHNVIGDSARFALSGSRSDSRISIGNGLWQVNADEGQIGQVIQNIVLNANEAMPGGGIVDIAASNEEIPTGKHPLLPDGGKFVQIAIKDSGIGISAEDISRIFDPYFTTRQKGSGLGLATSYSIVRNHGGVIEVRSEPNKGSTFSVYLPAQGAEESGEPGIPISLVNNKGRILLMDDEETIRSVAMQMIKTLGHEVESAVDGNDAIEKFGQAIEAGRPYDVVILDLTVRAGMGGEQAVAKLREINPEIKVIVSSGYADSPVTSDYRSYGFSACLNKPYSIDSLRDGINALLV